MTYQTVNPATGETEATFAGISDAELDAALAAARACFLDDWRHRTVADRARVVKAAATGLRAGAARYAQLVTTEMGKQNRKLVNVSPPWGPVPVMTRAGLR